MKPAITTLKLALSRPPAGINDYLNVHTTFIAGIIQLPKLVFNPMTSSVHSFFSPTQ